MTQTTHMEDAMGRLVPIENVKEIDLLRDSLVLGIVPKFKALQDEMRELKNLVLEDIAAFVELSGDRYDVKIGGDKGNVTLMTYNGRYKVVRAMADHMTFDEGLLAAEKLIGQCLTEWSADSRPELRVIVDQAFRRNKEGDISISKILSLRSLKIEDDRWKRAMEAISDSLKTVFAKAYVRVYERDERGGWQQITLDFAKL